MIAGLGNPGKKYARTRHNVGFEMVERLAEMTAIALDASKFKARFGRGFYRGIRVTLAEPMDYMNRSGPPLYQLAAYFNIPITRILVVHDDIEIAQGRIKIKAKGGHGGHNGLKSIIGVFGDSQFPRLRLGIGRPQGAVDVTDYVLGKFSETEWRHFEPVFERAESAVATILEKGVNAAMNQFNTAKESEDK